MNKILYFILTVVVLIIVACGTSYFLDKHQYNNWSIKSETNLSWAKFNWIGDTLGNYYFDKLAMEITTKIEGISYTFSFQFDLGSDFTVIYERNLNSVLKTIKNGNNYIGKLNPFLQFWDQRKSFKNLSFNLGNTKLSTLDCFIMKDYGENLEIDTNDFITPIQLGTIGVDIFQNKILIIDYPNQKFAICDSLPPIYNNSKFTDIELDGSGRIILPMFIKGNHYKISFDNGSSIFPIITLAKNISKFSAGQNIDTLKISSWGNFHNVISKMITDTFYLAGQKFSNIKVYFTMSETGIDKNTDGTAGNALFWGKIMIIDFRRKKFSLR